MTSPDRNRWLLTLGYVGVSAAVACASLRSALRFAALSERNVSVWWWLPSMELLRDPSPRGDAIFLIAAFAIGRAVKTRAHGAIAASTAGATVAAYFVLLDCWTTHPGPIVDPRLLFTMMFSRVPLYVAFVALAAHAAIAALNARKAE